MVWHAKPGCPAHRRQIVEKTVRGFPTAWLVNPVSGEVFDSMLECERRLRGFSFAEGFDIVRKGGTSKRTPGQRWKCIHWGEATENNRGLEEHVERNKEGEITLKRQREGTKIR